MKKALICGILGQDGSYLAKRLLLEGYEVIGTTRSAPESSNRNLHYLGIYDDVELITLDLRNLQSVSNLISRIKPDEAYNLSGQSSVALSFKSPVQTYESNVLSSLNLLESIRLRSNHTRFYNAGSSECFGNQTKASNEKTFFDPVSPYGLAKTASTNATKLYRETFGLFACTGILFNHESPLRPKHFATQKIVSTAHAIANKKMSELSLGNLSIRRDWGWAEEYVEAMAKMLQLETPVDLVIATGESHSLQEFVQTTFSLLGLDWTKHVVQSQTHFRPNEILWNCGDAALAKSLLGFSPKIKFENVAERMLEAAGVDT